MYSIKAIDAHSDRTIGIGLYITAIGLPAVMRGMMWRATNLGWNADLHLHRSGAPDLSVLRHPFRRRHLSSAACGSAWNVRKTCQMGAGAPLVRVPVPVHA